MSTPKDPPPVKAPGSGGVQDPPQRKFLGVEDDDDKKEEEEEEEEGVAVAVLLAPLFRNRCATASFLLKAALFGVMVGSAAAVVGARYAVGAVIGVLVWAGTLSVDDKKLGAESDRCRLLATIRMSPFTSA